MNGKVHPVAALFPMLTGSDLESLAEDIRANGLQNPIVMQGDVLLDGRNRMAACELVGVEPSRVQYAGADARAFIISANLYRRHLTRDQRDSVMVGLREQGMTLAKIAEAVGVSVGTVHSATRGELFNSEKVRGEDGKEYPAHYTPREKDDEEDDEDGCWNCKHLMLIEGDEWFCQEREGRTHPSLGRDCDSWQPESDGADASLDTHQLISQSKSNEWYTPVEYIEAARAVMGGIDIDPASNVVAQEWIKATEYHTIEDDGLAHEWRGRVWLNPPWGKFTGDFVSKLGVEIAAGRVTEAIVLVNAHATDTQWFTPLWDGLLCFTDHRINYASPMGDGTAGSTHGSVFVYFGTNRQAFIRSFSQWGTIVEKVTSDDS